MLENRTYGTAADDNNTAATLTRYVYSNHLQSASLELDENAAIISYEEYHPYGTTSYQAVNASINAAAKRYRYTGKERDEESGLYYHGARYYIPWLCRWVSVDPINSENYNIVKSNSQLNTQRSYLELAASGYEYCGDNPIGFIDPDGEQRTTAPVRNATRPSPPVSRNVRNNVRIDPNVLDPYNGGSIPIPLRGGRGTIWAPVNPNTGAGASNAFLLTLAAHFQTEKKVVYPTAEQSRFLMRQAVYNQKAIEKGAAPFTSIEERKKYEETQRITNDFNKLTEGEKNNIANRIAIGRATSQDLLFLSRIMQGTGRGLIRANAFESNWPTASLREVIQQFTPNYVLSSTDQKLIYHDVKSGFEVIYDKEGDYLRIRKLNIDGKRTFVDLTGNIPNNKIENGRTIGRTQAEYNQVTHFKNTDRK